MVNTCPLKSNLLESEFLWPEGDRVQTQALNSLTPSHSFRILRQLVFGAYSKVLGMSFYVCGHKTEMWLVCEWQECEPFSFESHVFGYFPISLQQTCISLCYQMNSVGKKCRGACLVIMGAEFNTLPVIGTAQLYYNIIPKNSFKTCTDFAGKL